MVNLQSNHDSNTVFEECSIKIKRKGKPVKVNICAIMIKLFHIVFAVALREIFLVELFLGLGGIF